MDTDDFSYDGRLVFNGVHTTKVLVTDFDFEQAIKNELLSYTRGEFEQPGRGYETIPFAEYMEESPGVSRRIREALGEVHAFRYLKEEWEELEGEDSPQTVLTNINSFGVYWLHPDFLFVRGDKDQAEQANSLLTQSLGDQIKINKLDFDSDFLLWLFSKEKRDTEYLPGELTVNMLTDAEIEGNEPDLFGKHNKIDSSTDITKSAPVLMGVLRQKEITSLEGVFGLYGRFVRARISTDGRIHVKADHAIRGSSDIERVATSLAFLREITSLYEHWVGLDAEDRYPPLEFFTDLYEECQRQGVKITFSIDDVIKEYRQKGSIEEYQQYQSGLSEF